jgi:hypothetical protein
MVFHKFPQSVRENWSVSSHTSRATSSETSSDLELGSIPRNRCVVTIIGVEQQCTSIWTLESRSFRVFWDVLQCSQINVDIDLRTRHYIPEDKSELHTRRRENLKSHLESRVCCFCLQGVVGDCGTSGASGSRFHGHHLVGPLCWYPYENQRRDEPLPDMAPALPCRHPLQCQPHLSLQGRGSGIQTVSHGTPDI